MRHLMSPLDFSVEELDQLMDLANDIEKNPEKYAHACDGKRLATLFYESSTRTRLSFEAAMMNLGGRHHPRGILLCKYLCHASSERRRSARCIDVLPYSCD